MALANYADLQTAVASWLNRTDLTAVLPDFVTLAEARIKREILSRLTETKTASAAATEFVALPSDFGQLERVEVTHGEEPYQLEYIPANAVEYEEAGFPKFYTFENKKLRLIPAPSGDITMTLHYVPQLTALSAGVNWLMTNHPDVYLWATCVEGAGYLKDKAEEDRFEAKLQAAVMSVWNQSGRQRLGTSSRLAVRPRTYR